MVSCLHVGECVSERGSGEEEREEKRMKIYVW